MTHIKISIADACAIAGAIANIIGEEGVEQWMRDEAVDALHTLFTAVKDSAN